VVQGKTLIVVEASRGLPFVDAEPTPKRMIEILEQIKKMGAKYFFAEKMVTPKMS
jgi:hypothetical protein